MISKGSQRLNWSKIVWNGTNGENGLESYKSVQMVPEFKIVQWGSIYFKMAHCSKLVPILKMGKKYLKQAGA